MPSKVLTACLAALIGGAFAALPARAADAPSCATVRMADPGWTDITSTNAMMGVVLEALGYKQNVVTASVPIIFESLKNKSLDVFLGNWMPAQTPMVTPLLDAKQAEIAKVNLTGVKFTLAVPKYVADAGITTIADVAKNKDKFDGKIYSIEAGSAANLRIQKMIDDPASGFGGWQLVETSEQGMLAQVDRLKRRKEWAVFLGWEPHPMNIKYEPTYLGGGDTWLGANYGAATVQTVTRATYAAECPNVDRLAKQLVFSVAQENAIMNAILDGAEPRKAASAQLKADPAVLDAWLAGVTTRDGAEALPAVKAKLGV